MKHLLEASHTHEPDETIESIIQPNIPVFSSNAFLDDVLPVFLHAPVVLVMDGESLLGILIKIDLLDFMSRRI